jgi:integrase
LKAYLLVSASSGTRAVETCAIRLRDIDFSVKPTKIHIRKEYAKTRVSRDIYISDEATKYLKDWIFFKYCITSNSYDNNDGAVVLGNDKYHHQNHLSYNKEKT